MTSKLKLLTVGSDPEVILFDRIANHNVSAERYVKGSKHDPFIFDDEGFTIQSDNVMAEFTFPPVTNPLDFYNNCQKCLDYLNKQIPANMQVMIQPAAIYPAHELKSVQANLFGCDPDMNAWTCLANVAPNAKKTDIRSAGGHIHLGIEHEDGTRSDANDCVYLVRALDLFLGVPSIILDGGIASKMRRKLYGKAGAFRIKEYGLEYRTLSNFFIRSKESVDWVFDGIYRAIEFVNEGHMLNSEEDKDIVDAIDDANYKLVNKLIDKYKLHVKAEVEQTVVV